MADNASGFELFQIAKHAAFDIARPVPFLIETVNKAVIYVIGFQLFELPVQP